MKRAEPLTAGKAPMLPSWPIPVTPPMLNRRPMRAVVSRTLLVPNAWFGRSRRPHPHRNVHETFLSGCLISAHVPPRPRRLQIDVGGHHLDLTHEAQPRIHRDDFKNF